jgi:hypothetical protein
LKISELIFWKGHSQFLKAEIQDSNNIGITVIEKEAAFSMLGLKKKPQKNTEKKECSYDIITTFGMLQCYAFAVA